MCLKNTCLWIHCIVLLHMTVDFATSALQNSVCVTQQMSHIMTLFQDCSMIKDESYKIIE
jgi:hypothetical protein